MRISVESDKYYQLTTEGIRVSVQPCYLEDESDPEDGHYFWAYKVQIENLGTQPVVLKSRYWRITDACGHTEEVRGDGVVGEQPVIKPGFTFEYTSGTPLGTASGFMTGSYRMHRSDGSIFDVEIPHFSLDSPHISYTVN